MSKIKEYYHEEICAMGQEDKEYAVTHMSKVSELTQQWLEGTIDTQQFTTGVVFEASMFDNMHTRKQ